MISPSGRGFFERDTAVSLFLSTKELAGELPHHAKGTLFYCASTERPVDLCLEFASFFLRPRRPRFRARRTLFGNLFGISPTAVIYIIGDMIRILAFRPQNLPDTICCGSFPVEGRP